MVSTKECATVTEQIKTERMESPEILTDDLSRLNEDNIGLRVRVQRLEMALAKMKTTARNLREERDRLKRKLRDVQAQRVGSRQSRSPTPSVPDECSDIVDLSRAHSPPPSIILERCAGLGASKPTVIGSPSKVQTKLAEKVRLRRCSPRPEKNRWVDGAEISALGMSTTAVAEYLVHEISEESTAQENLHELEFDDRDRNVELQFERLRSQNANLRAEVSFLELTLNESRSCSEYLATVCAQLESNQTALKLALNFGAQIDELSDCAVRIACQSEDDGMDRKLAAKLLNYATPEMQDSMEAEMTDSFRNASDEGFGSANEAKSSSSTLPIEKYSSIDLINALLNRKASLVEEKERVLDTVTGVEGGFHQWDWSYCSSGTNCIQQQRIDLENAVLIQELAALKEEKADLKCQLYLMERDKESIELVLEGKLAEINASRILLEETAQNKNEQKKDGESELALIRNRLTDLMDAVQILTENSDLRQKQNDQFVTELRTANQTLVSAFERLKSKHRNKITRFQEQTDVMRERYEAQIRILRSELEANNNRGDPAASKKTETSI